jgi:hypothetical protein
MAFLGTLVCTQLKNKKEYPLHTEAYRGYLSLRLILLRLSDLVNYLGEAKTKINDIGDDADHVVDDHCNLNNQLNDLKRQVTTHKHNCADDGVHDDV